MTNHKEWLDSLKPGDEITQIITTTWGPPRIETLTVSRRTATQIIMTNGVRFRAIDGLVIGNGIYGNLCHPPSAERIQKIHDRHEQINIGKNLNEIRWREVPLDKLRRIKAILEETAP